MAALIYDGYCPRCVAFARWGGRWSRGRLDVLSFEAPGAMQLHPDLSYARAQSAPQMVLDDGRLTQGAEAVAWVLGSRPGFGFIPVLYQAPGFKQAARLLYWAFKARSKPCAACP